MEGRFTSAQVAVRFGVVQMGAAFGLAALLSMAPLADSARAQSADQPGSNSSGNASAQTVPPRSSAPRSANPAPLSVRRPDLELGRRGGAVAELQAVLKLLGFYPGEVNGQYDEATSLAVARFQVAAKLPQTGRVSSQTWNALFPVEAPTGAIATAPTQPTPPRPAPVPPQPAPTPPQAAAAPQPSGSQPQTPRPALAQPAPAQAPEPQPSPYPTLKLGAEGDAVLRLQRRLGQKGFLTSQPDGDFGPMTEAAVKAAQEALGLTVDGVVGPATWQALLQ